MRIFVHTKNRNCTGGRQESSIGPWKVTFNEVREDINIYYKRSVDWKQSLYILPMEGKRQLKSFIEKCKTNGQVGGIYWTPFTDWARNPERTVDAAYTIEPTHPAVEAMMKKTSELFHHTGFEYVKMDFMTHGMMEADRWYRPELNKYFGDMYINLSISPIFPAPYAQSRRIACDAWNMIKDTETGRSQSISSSDNDNKYIFHKARYSFKNNVHHETESIIISFPF